MLPCFLLASRHSLVCIACLAYGAAPCWQRKATRVPTWPPALRSAPPALAFPQPPEKNSNAHSEPPGFCLSFIGLQGRWRRAPTPLPCQGSCPLFITTATTNDIFALAHLQKPTLSLNTTCLLVASPALTDAPPSSRSLLPSPPPVLGLCLPLRTKRWFCC